MDVVFQSPLEAALAFNYFNYVSFEFLATTTLHSLFTCVAILTAAATFWRFTSVVVASSNSLLRGGRTKSKSSSANFDDGDHSSTPPPPAVLHVVASPPPPPLVLPSLVATPPAPPDHDEQVATSTCNTNWVRRRRRSSSSSSSSSSSFVGPIPIEDDSINGEKRVNNLKTKFTLYYSQEDIIDDDEADDEDESNNNTEEVPIEEGAVHAVSSFAKILHSNSNGRRSCDGISPRREGDFLMSWYRYQDLTVLNGSVVRLWGCRQRRRNSSSPSASFPPSCPTTTLQVIG